VRVTADTNIYISALNFGGPPAEILRLAAEGDIRLSISSEIIGEVIETLRRKFLWPDGRIEDLRRTLGEIAELVVPTVRIDLVDDDPDDNRILECAHAARADFIVTGDKDLLRIGTYDSTPILTVAEFLRRRSAE